MVQPAYYEEHEMTLEEVKAILDGFERQYGMTSEEFLEKWKKGETEWVDESVAWHGLFEPIKPTSAIRKIKRRLRLKQASTLKNAT